MTLKCKFFLLVGLMAALIVAGCGDDDDEGGSAPKLNSNHPGWGNNACFTVGCHANGGHEYPHGDKYDESDCQSCHGKNEARLSGLTQQ